LETNGSAEGVGSLEVHFLSEEKGRKWPGEGFGVSDVLVLGETSFELANTVHQVFGGLLELIAFALDGLHLLFLNFAALLSCCTVAQDPLDATLFLLLCGLCSFPETILVRVVIQ
jgi:hypothetical protein